MHALPRVPPRVAQLLNAQTIFQFFFSGRLSCARDSEETWTTYHKLSRQNIARSPHPVLPSHVRTSTLVPICRDSISIITPCQRFLFFKTDDPGVVALQEVTVWKWSGFLLKPGISLQVPCSEWPRIKLDLWSKTELQSVTSWNSSTVCAAGCSKSFLFILSYICIHSNFIPSTCIKLTFNVSFSSFVCNSASVFLQQWLSLCH